MSETARIHSRFDFGPVTAWYWLDGKSGALGLEIFPSAMRSKRAKRRPFLKGVEVDNYARSQKTRFAAWQVQSLAQVFERGDVRSGGFSQGRTLLGGSTTERLRFVKQDVTKTGDRLSVVSAFQHDRAGWRFCHELSGRKGDGFLESRGWVENTSKEPITLDMLSSFALTGISSFAPDDAPGRLLLHRFRSTWSMEGRLVSERFEDLQLEPSWVGWGRRSERWGAVGSMPVSGWFGTAMIEDVGAGVTWGAQIHHNASWQFEAYRRHDLALFSGGLADRELGHWSRTLAPGETFLSPKATLTSVAGGVDEASRALLRGQEATVHATPEAEKDLPVVYNEWATSWGKPSHANMALLAARLEGSGVKYLVIDAGWYANDKGEWGDLHGDWDVSKKLYPRGLRATADAIRARGLVPGLWFEMETCGPGSALFRREEFLLHRDGKPLQSGSRRFLDMANPAVIEYLTEKVIGTLRDGGFGYLKVDYNDTMGIGADGPHSTGETMRRSLEGSRRFFEKIRAEVPGIVIENCSSGGHRLEPSMMGVVDMGSFSDAHESREIPVIAANLQRLILPRQSQIWACLRKGEGDRRTVYSLAAGFLGRLCVSGDIALSNEQWKRVKEATALYAHAAPVIARGVSRRSGPAVQAYRHPEGWQAVERISDDGKAIVLVVHTFEKPGQAKFSFPLPAGKWNLAGALHEKANAPKISGNKVSWTPGGEWAGLAAVLKKAD